MIKNCFLYTVSALMSELRKREQEEEEKKNATFNGECCACPPSEKEIKEADREREMEIKFQDFLQNQVYIKRLVHRKLSLYKEVSSQKTKSI